jgi:hypothetical protein
MSAYLIALALCVGSDPTTTEERPFHEIEREIGEALKSEARAKEFADRAQSVCKLAKLHDEVRRDARRETSDTLAAFQTRLRGRLLKVKKELEREQSRQNPAKANQRQPDDALLQATTPQPSQAVTAALAMQLDWFGSSQGGAAKLLSDGAQSQAGARGGGTVPDNGPALVDLIERTISPDHWDTNGGPGAIIYYQPLHVLVIRASGEVHGSVSRVLGGLRAAGP